MYLYSARIGVSLLDPSLNVFSHIDHGCLDLLLNSYALFRYWSHSGWISFSREALLVINGFFHPWTPSFLTYPFSFCRFPLCKKCEFSLDCVDLRYLLPYLEKNVTCDFVSHLQWKDTLWVFWFLCCTLWVSGRDLGRIESNQSPSTPFFV